MRLTRDGYVEAVRVTGVPVRIHWTLPLGAVVPATFIGFQWLQSIYLCIGYLLLIGVHETGHAVAARAFSLDVTSIDITGFGGMCMTEQPRSARSALWLYSGGLVAQAVLFALTLVIVAIVGKPPTLFLNCLIFMFTAVNCILFLVNAIPIRSTGHPTDGVVLWAIVRELRRRA